ncbi:PilT domain-containing protein [Caballeronia terrestris]|uniref:PilT domain-containing protein n=1 Tax=Caballeronia terrestris TaxID=1226301 RepID=A0A158KI44_9BURK|nr:type II toxin-antitoxin system VapC family toxin [Caballeronia terrestris]SAL80802.1 PilT domain-containing protein [Caballeronia terrestris]
MRVLLDTHIALWAAEGAPQLSSAAIDLIEDPANTLLVEHAEAVAALPFHDDHADPFDRIMIAQALHEGIALLSADPKVWRYHPTLMIRA